MLERVGGLVLGLLGWVGDVALFGGRALSTSVVPPYEFKETWRQVFEVGWRSLPLVALSGFAVGVVLSMHTRASLERFGAESMIRRGSPLRWFARPARWRQGCSSQVASVQASVRSSGR